MQKDKKELSEENVVEVKKELKKEELETEEEIVKKRIEEIRKRDPFIYR
jgi:hypothetical protein